MNVKSPDESATAYYQRITENYLTLPDGSLVRYDFKTLQKWVSDYKRGGIDALLPKERVDKGTTRVLDDNAIEEIFNLRNKYPIVNATMIHTNQRNRCFHSITWYGKVLHTKML